MYKIEFLKIFKRRYNYIYFFFILGLGLLTLFQKNRFIKFLDVEKDFFLYNYFLKYFLFSIMLISIINIVISYREDFKNKVNTLLVKFNISNFKHIFSKICANFLVFASYYFLILVSFLGYLIFRKELFLGELLTRNSIYYVSYSISAILFTLVLVTFILTIFNNTNIALALTLLYFLGSKFLAAYLVTINNLFSKLDYTVVNIFNVIVKDLTIAIQSFPLNTIALFANILILFLFSLIFNSLKRN